MNTGRIAVSRGRQEFRRQSIRLPILSALILLVVACGPTVPSPLLSSPTSPTSSQAAITPLVAALQPAPEDCEDFDFVPCPRQVAQLSLPLAGSDFALTYASDRVPGRTIASSLDASGIGLGGWSLNILNSYDSSAGVVVLGTGERRVVKANAVTQDGAPAFTVPSQDSADVFVFDAQGRQMRTYDAITATLLYRFEWVPAGLASVTEPGGRVTRIRRDASGLPVEIVSARGYRTELGMNAGWLGAVADPSGNIASITTSANGLVGTLVDPTGATTSFKYDTAGRLTELDGPNGATTAYKRADLDGGFTVTATTGAGRTWSDGVRFDGTKIVRTHVDPNGLSTTVTIDGANRTLTSPDGTTTSLVLAGDPRWGLGAPMLTNVVSTTPAGRTQKIAEARTETAVTSTLDATTRNLTIDDVTWKLAFDPTTRTTTLTGPDGQTRATTLDTSGRPIRAQTSGSAATVYHYDDHGEVDTLTVGDGASARVWRYAADRTTGDLLVTDPLGHLTTIRADPSGRISAVEPASGERVGQAYDHLGRLAAVTAPSGAATRTSYRGDGTVDTVTSPSGSDGLRFTTYGYDPDGLVAQVGFVDGSGIAEKRDGAGRITQVDAGAGAWTIGYDPATGAATTFDGPGAKLQRTFDGSDLVVEAWTGPLATSVTHSVDPAGRDTADTVAGSLPVAYAYDPAGRLVQAGALKLTRDAATGLVTQEQIGSLTTTWQYDVFGAVIGQTVTSGATHVYDLTLVRDGLGRVTTRTEHVGGAVHTRRFTYSPVGRLTTVRENGKTTTYTYDANGNLTREQRPDGTTIVATYDGRDALVRRGTTAYAYDAAGRLATETTPAGVTSYAYDKAGHLLAVTPATGPKVQYVLDGTGRRIGTKVGGAVVRGFAYLDPLRPAAMLDASGKVTERFVYGLGISAPTYIVRDGKTLLIVVDDLGTPRLLVDAANGSVVDQLQTDALGSSTGATDPGMLPFGFAGGLVDPETGFLHFGARDYDPSVGRWTAPDPFGSAVGDANPYRYGGGDPVNRVDPTGLCDVETGSLNWAVGFGDHSYSGGAGYVRAGSEGAPYTYTGSGYSTPTAGISLDFGCLLERDPNKPGSPLDDFAGSGTSGNVDVGPFSVGGDVSGTPGNPSLFGPHVGGGLGVAPAAGSVHTTNTTLWGRPAKDPGPDGPLIDFCIAGIGCRPADGQSGPLTKGEPHLTTADTVRYDFMAAGEFTALRSDSGDLVVQVRQIPLDESRWLAVNSAVAMNVNGDRLSFARTDTGFVVDVNGEPFLATAATALPKGGTLTPEDQSFLVAWPDHTVVRVMPYGSGLDVGMELAPGRSGTVHGLLGPATGKASTTIEASDGTTIDIPVDGKPDYQKLYRSFGDSWRITQAESLFDYAPGESTATYDKRSFPDPNPPAVPPEQTAAATVVCTQVGLVGPALAECVFDVAATGDAGFAVTDAQSTLVGPQTLGEIAAGAAPQTLQGYPITVDGPAVTATIGAAGAIADFTFTATAGQKVYVAVPASTLPDTCGGLTLRDPGNVLIGSGCLINGTGAIDGTVLPATGAYSILFAPASGATGDIQVRLTSAVDVHGTIGVDGPVVSGTIGQAGASATYTFAGTAGQKVFLDVPSSTLPGDCAALTLRGPDNAVVTSGCLIDGDGSIDGTVMATTGQYSIVVDPGGGATGDFQLRLHS